MSYANVTTKLDYLNPVFKIRLFSICSFIWMIFFNLFIHLPCFVCVLSFEPILSGWFEPVLFIGLLNIVLSFEFFFLFISFVCVLLFYPLHSGWFEPVLYIEWISIVLSFEWFFFVTCSFISLIFSFLFAASLASLAFSTSSCFLLSSISISRLSWTRKSESYNEGNEFILASFIVQIERITLKLFVKNIDNIKRTEPYLRLAE